MSDFIVVRRPVLMEDEGRYYPTKVFHSKVEADLWIQQQATEYFKPQDYYVVKVDE